MRTCSQLGLNEMIKSARCRAGRPTGAQEFSEFSCGKLVRKSLGDGQPASATFDACGWGKMTQH